MLTLLINETKPLAGLFASSTGGIGSVPDISVADEGQAVSVQTFTRTAGVITDSFVAGDVLHIGIGDGVNAPVCYIELSSASFATGTMAINTVGMVALFAATVANRLSLQVGVVRTRGAYTNTIFSAPIVIHRSVIDPDTAVPTPSILGAGVAAALLVAINTALGFVRLDASARLPAVDGSQLTNVPNELPSQTGNNGKYLTTNGTATSWGTVSTGLTVGTTVIASGTSGRILYDNAGVLGELPVGTGVATALAVNVGSAGAFLTSAVTSITGTANEITVTGTTTPTLSLPTALTFTGKTVTGGTFASSTFTTPALGTPASGDFGTGTFTWPTFDQSTTGSAATLTTMRTIGGSNFNGSADVTSFPAPGAIGGTTPSTIAGTTGTFSGELSTTGAAAYLATYGAAAHIYTDGANAQIYTSGTNASISTGGSNAHIMTGSSGAYIQSRSTFRLNGGTFVTTLSHAATANRAIALPDAAGTLALTSDITGGTLAGSFTTLTASATTSLLLGTAGSAVGNVGFRNATSGTTTLAPATGALGTGTVTLPLSGTLATLEGAETFTGAKTFSANPVRLSGNQSAAAWTTTGTGLVQAAASYTDTSSSGTVAVTAINNLAAPTLLASSATTYTDSFVTRMAGPPVASTNVTQTRAHTLGILDSTSASSATTGGLVVSAAFGTAATSVGIGGGTVFVGAQIYLNSTSNWLLTGGNAEMALINGACDLRIGGNMNALWAFNDNTRDLGGSAKQWRSLYIGTSIVNSGTLAVTGATTLTGLLTANGGITLGDAQNIAFNATTGTKIGTATTQKLSFWNATPIVQPTTAVASATFASPGAGTNIKTDDTFDGYTIAQVVKALRNAGLLA